MRWCYSEEASSWEGAMVEFLTADDVAEVLRITPEQVGQLLDSGELQCFEVLSGERRIVAASLTEFIDRRTRKKRSQVLMAPGNQFDALARVIAEDHSLREQFASMDATPGTFGDMLRNAATSTMIESDSRGGKAISFHGAKKDD